MTGIIARSRHMRQRFCKAVRQHGGQILYYGGVAVALAALAIAAERYREARPQEPVDSVLPVVELSAPAEAGEEEALAFHAPEGAKLLRGYAAQPSWNASLGFWETHPALDYLLNGDVVTSLSEGIVRAVGKGGTRGGFVEVETGEYLLRYASIAPDERIVPGDTLKAGVVIGTANMSMPGEAEFGAHLHMELMKDGRYVNFEELCDDTNG